MKIIPIVATALVVSAPAFAEEARHADAHEHGVGQLDIAIDGTDIAMVLHAPGADIVGFEHEATDPEDVAKVDAALVRLNDPLSLFVIGGTCTVSSAMAELEGDEEHDNHDDHDEHEEHHEDGHDDHDEHAEEEAGHSEFHAEYSLTCANPTSITFDYFTAFPNALELEVQLITDKGATAFEIERDAPTLDLSGH